MDIPIRKVTTAPKIDPEKIGQDGEKVDPVKYDPDEYAGVGPNDAYVHSDTFSQPVDMASDAVESLTWDIVDALRRYRRSTGSVPSQNPLLALVRGAQYIVELEAQVVPEGKHKTYA